MVAPNGPKSNCGERTKLALNWKGTSASRVEGKTMNCQRLKRFFVLGMIGLAGCAGAAVTQQAKQTPVSSEHPTRMVVYPFAVDPEEVTLNRGFIQRAYRGVTATNQNEKQAAIADDLSQSVCLNVAVELSKRGYNATCLPRGTAPSADNVIIVDGEFNNVSEGNRLSRTVIGFGMGASTLDTDVYVIQRVDGTSNQIMRFSTHANSGKMPGVAVTGAPGAAAGGAVAAASLGANVTMSAAKGYKSSMGSLGRMTADQIIDHLSQYFAEHGWTGNAAGQRS
jgi:Domain of unknown function (DUF4410)